MGIEPKPHASTNRGERSSKRRLRMWLSPMSIWGLLILVEKGRVVLDTKVALPAPRRPATRGTSYNLP